MHNQCATYWNRPFTPFVLEEPQRFLLSVNRLFREDLLASLVDDIRQFSRDQHHDITLVVARCTGD